MTACVSKAAPVENPAAGKTEPSLPREGEISLTGTVISVNAAQGTFDLKAMSFALPNGKSGVLATPKTKSVAVNAQTAIRATAGKQAGVLADLKPGAGVTVTGADLGTGKAIPARSVTAVAIKTAARSTAPKPPAYKGLLQARAGFRTKLIPNKFKSAGPIEAPRDKSFQIIRYPSPVGDLVAYLSADPGDGKKHPAVLWAHGGFGGVGNSSVRQAQAFKDAGFIVLCPAWRGESENPGKFELFFGEVDDAVAAVDYLAQVPYVDPSRLYMVGHSTGGTITLLTAESTPKLRAAFSFGGAPNLLKMVEDGEGYGNTPYDYSVEAESYWRSPIYSVSLIRSPTFYFEGADSAYVADARSMGELAEKDNVPFKAFIIKGGDHFNIVPPLTKMLAKKMLADTGAKCNITLSDDEVQRAFSGQASNLVR